MKLKLSSDDSNVYVEEDKKVKSEVKQRSRTDSEEVSSEMSVADEVDEKGVCEQNLSSFINNRSK